VQNDDSPAVASARPRWKESWIAVNASPWDTSTGRTKRSAPPPATRAFDPTSAAAYMSPAASPKPAPGASRGATGPIASAAATYDTANQAATAIQEP
jgi:hypothetical protein